VAVLVLSHQLERADLTQALRFCCVGLSGVAVNFAFLTLFTEFGHLHYVLSAALATEIAILSNFALNHSWTFRSSHGASPLLKTLGKFNAVALGGLAISVGALWWLTHSLALHYLVANVLAIVSATTWNFCASRRWAWGRSFSPSPSGA
jgi:putative flippase GtrA